MEDLLRDFMDVILPVVAVLIFMKLLDIGRSLTRLVQLTEQINFRQKHGEEIGSYIERMSDPDE